MVVTPKINLWLRLIEIEIIAISDAVTRNIPGSTSIILMLLNSILIIDWLDLFCIKFSVNNLLHCGEYGLRKQSQPNDCHNKRNENKCFTQGKIRQGFLARRFS